jgi:hypothetical protein
MQLPFDTRHYSQYSGPHCQRKRGSTPRHEDDSFAWERGGGLRPYRNLTRFARVLRRHQIRPVFVLKQPETARLLDAGAGSSGAPVAVRQKQQERSSFHRDHARSACFSRTG